MWEMKVLDPVIEPAREEDMQEVIRILKACGNYFKGEEKWLARSRTLVARHGGRIIGSMSYESSPDGYSHVFGLSVEPGFRGKGVGTRLVRHVEMSIYEEGGRGLTGEALNEELAQFYVRVLGARICRLSLRGWRSNLVPFRKNFRQEGAWDSFKRAIRRFVLFWVRMKHLRILVEILESAARRVKGN
jgi:GNAT superfamily N-acetyltransferase